MSKFNINKHEWSDSSVVINAIADAVIVIELKGKWVCFDKEDAIAMARHFELTAEDLERG